MLIYNIMYPQLAIKKINYIFTLIQNTDILLNLFLNILLH